MTGNPARPCPFCGECPKYIGKLWWHTENGCFLGGMWFDEKDNNLVKWNRRANE